MNKKLEVIEIEKHVPYKIQRVGILTVEYGQVWVSIQHMVMLQEVKKWKEVKVHLNNGTVLTIKDTASIQILMINFDIPLG